MKRVLAINTGPCFIMRGSICFVYTSPSPSSSCSAHHHYVVKWLIVILVFFFFNLEVNIHHHRHVLFLRRSLPLPVAERLYRPLPKSYTARCRTPRCGQLPNSRYRLGVRFPNHCSASEMFCWHDRFTPLQRRQKVFSCILSRCELVFLSQEILKKLVLSVICVLQTVFQINHWVSITHFHTSNQYKPLFFSHC